MRSNLRRWRRILRLIASSDSLRASRRSTRRRIFCIVLRASRSSTVSRYLVASSWLCERSNDEQLIQIMDSSAFGNCALCVRGVPVDGVCHLVATTIYLLSKRARRFASDAICSAKRDRFCRGALSRRRRFAGPIQCRCCIIDSGATLWALIAAQIPLCFDCLREYI